VHVGAAWTTDAPYRETEQIIAARKAQGILAVEMESAALYAFAKARGCPLICLAHVSNQLGCVEGDFEKGIGNGARSSVELIRSIAGARLYMSSSATKAP
jgi:nucleoside phosphorylase